MCKVNRKESGYDGNECVFVEFFLEECDSDRKCNDDADARPDEIGVAKIGELVCLVQEPCDGEVAEQSEDNEFVTMLVIINGAPKAKLCNGFGYADEQDQTCEYGDHFFLFFIKFRSFKCFCTS